MASPGKPPSETPLLASLDRLESWKEIAAYLGRDVRTVQRWEKHAGLPVHRHPNDKVAAVFAFPPELDAWRNNGAAQAAVAQTAAIPEASSRRKVWASIFAVVILGVAATGVWRLQQPRLTFHERDWVLISDFENRTGDSLFDGTIEAALRRELSNSKFVNVVSPERVADTMRLMRKPPETRLDRNLGREVSLRDGGIRALVSGRIEKAGSALLLSAEIVEPAGGKTVAAITQEASSQQDLFAAIRWMAFEVRKELGEALPEIERSKRELEKVTTPSLRALQLYTEAEILLREYSKARVAAELLRKALAEDPDFAMAHIMLAWSIPRVPSQTEWRTHSERAFQLADGVSERERYFIIGSYHGMRAEPQKAIAAYEALLRLYPDDYWAVNNIIYSLRDSGRGEQAVQYISQRAALRPQSFYLSFNSAQLIQGPPRQLSANNSELARALLLRANQLITSAVEQDFPVAVIRARFALHGEHRTEGLSLIKPENIVEVLMRSPRNTTPDGECLFGAAWFLVEIGRLKAAKECAMSSSDPSTRAALRPAAFFGGNREALRESLPSEQNQHAGERLEWAMMMARLGDPQLARRMVPQKIDGPYQSHLKNIVEGEIARKLGQGEKAIRLLEQGLTGVLEGGVPIQRTSPIFLMGVQSLSQLWSEQGNLEKSRQILEKGSEMGVPVAVKPLPSLSWIQTQMELAKVYRALGKAEDANKKVSGLKNLLLFADPDLPLLKELENWSEQETSVARGKKTL